MSGAADSIEVDIWTVAFVLAQQSRSGPVQTGWNRVPMPAQWLASPGPGLYYVTLRAMRGSQISLPIRPARVLELRWVGLWRASWA